MKIRTTTYRICVRTGKRQAPQRHRVINATEQGLLETLSEEQVKQLKENGKVWNEVKFPNIVHWFELYEIVE